MFRRTLPVLIGLAIAAGAPASAWAQDRDRDRDRDERREQRDPPRPVVRSSPLSDSVPANCRYSRDTPDGRKVFRCEVEPGRYVDRVF